MSKPRKFEPGTRQVRQEWVGFQEERLIEQIECERPGEVQSYFPEAFDKRIPEEGAWIFVIDPPVTELSARFEVPLLSIWRARPDESSTGRLKVPGGRTFSRHLAVIRTPGGDLWLHPHEYTMCGDITEFIGAEPDIEMHDLGGSPMLDEDQHGQLFYLQKAGITRHDALLMMLPQLTQQDLYYFTLHPDLAELFRGVGVPLWKHIAVSRAARPIEEVAGI